MQMKDSGNDVDYRGAGADQKALSRDQRREEISGSLWTGMSITWTEHVVDIVVSQLLRYVGTTGVTEIIAPIHYSDLVSLT